MYKILTNGRRTDGLTHKLSTLLLELINTAKNYYFGNKVIFFSMNSIYKTIMWSQNMWADTIWMTSALLTQQLFCFVFLLRHGGGSQCTALFSIYMVTFIYILVILIVSLSIRQFLLPCSNLVNNFKFEATSNNIS